MDAWLPHMRWRLQAVTNPARTRSLSECASPPLPLPPAPGLNRNAAGAGTNHAPSGGCCGAWCDEACIPWAPRDALAP